MERKHVCVIGAGLAGIVTIKELEEQGHRVTCFDKREQVGGVFSDDRTYDSVLLTVSNYFMAYSDLMPTDERLRYWTKQEYRRYLERYVEHFGVSKSVEFGAAVTGLLRTGNRWEVSVERAGETETRLFDAVAVCSGQFQKPHLPAIPGLDDFGGEVRHSIDYKNAAPFAGQRVLCIGLGESSADLTTEIGEVASKTLLSLRRYPLVAQRYFAVVNRRSYDPYLPLDVFTTSRSYNALPRDIHTKVTRGIFKQFINSHDPATRLRGQWNHDAGPESQQVIMKNERVFDAIVDGKVVVNASGIDHLERGAVVFGDGSRETIDAVVCCTGFELSLPFLEGALSAPIEDPRDLYKNMFHPELGDSLSLIGFVRPQQGGVPALAELQARYFALVCSGQCPLPAGADLRARIAVDRERWKEEFSLSPNVRSLVNYVHFSEDLARCIGCEPRLDRRADRALYRICHEGPLWAIQYRLRGPGSRPEKARQILLDKAPVPGDVSPLERLFFGALLWLRRVLPVRREARPRTI
jgi:dimethylaniline monooxygenase (N-oxide forming)